MESYYTEINIDKVELDFENPRIAKYIEQYGREELTSEALALALGGGTDDKNSTSYSSLKESIKTNGGIIHPIIINKTTKGSFVVIEGNTRVQIYKEFKEKKISGKWDSIRAIVYDELEDSDIHAIRLQSHLVGPREWDPYSKAKYLNYLSNQQKLPMSQVISFCGGKQNEIRRFIDAYNDMEKYYRNNLDDDSEFDQRNFSKFVELQNTGVKETIVMHKYDLNNFAIWVINNNIDTAQNVRKLSAIFKNVEATKVFLKTNISEALKVLVVEDIDTSFLKNVPYDVLALELAKRLKNIEYKEVMRLKYDSNFEEKKEHLCDALNELTGIIEVIDEE